jgi:hypothetical protein
MEKIQVSLGALYGYSCDGCSHSSNENIEVEIDDAQLEALRRIGKEKITCKDVAKAIKKGVTVLEALHKELEDKSYYMIEEYWLYEAYNEFLHESLTEAIIKDVRDGLYTPVKKEDEEETFDCHCNIPFYEDDADGEEEEENANTDDNQSNYDRLNDDDWDEDEDDVDQWDLDDYYDWVCSDHDHAFVAERIGLNLEACRDDEVSYTIQL